MLRGCNCKLQRTVHGRPLRNQDSELTKQPLKIFFLRETGGVYTPTVKTIIKKKYSTVQGKHGSKAR